MTLEQFNKMYLPHAQELIPSDSNSALRLCQKTFEIIHPDNRHKPNLVLLEMSRIYYEVAGEHFSRDTRDVVERIYGSAVAGIDNAWIPLEDCLHILKEPLYELPLHDRLVGSLRILDFPYDCIASLYNDTLSRFSKDLGTPMTLTEAHRLLDKIVEEFTLGLQKLSIYPTWLREIVGQKDDFTIATQGLQIFRTIASMKTSLRFARRSNPSLDEYAWFRDRWKHIKSHIGNRLKLNSFISNTRTRMHVVDL